MPQETDDAPHRYYSYAFQVCFWDWEVTFDWTQAIQVRWLDTFDFDCILQVLGVLVAVANVIPC